MDNSYNSHTDLRYPPGSGGGGLCSASGSTKEGILTKRMATLFNDGIKTTSSPNSIVLEPISDHRRSFENESGNNFLRNGKDSVDLQVNKPQKTVFLMYNLAEFPNSVPVSVNVNVNLNLVTRSVARVHLFIPKISCFHYVQNFQC